jgi:3-phytase
VTSPHPPLVFSADQDEVDEQTSAYGLAAWRDPDGGGTYVVVSRRSRTEVALLRLVDDGGRVGYEEVDRLALPSTFTLPNGTTWSPCEDPGDEPQVEGTVVDAKRGIVFAAQEDVGVWRWSVSADGFGEPVVVDRVREYGVPATFDEATEECTPSGADPGFGGRHLSADAEGLTIYYGRGDRGYLLASSQGDSTFAAYDRRGLGGFLGTFELRDGAVDGVQDSDGAAVLGNPLGKGFPKGLLVTHDGQNTPDVTGADGEVRPNTNFKLTRWEDVAAAIEPALRVGPDGPDPRTLQGAPTDRAPVRFATYNASLNRNAAGDLVRDLSTPDNPQAAGWPRSSSAPGPTCCWSTSSTSSRAGPPPASSGTTTSASPTGTRRPCATRTCTSRRPTPASPRAST